MNSQFPSGANLAELYAEEGRAQLAAATAREAAAESPSSAPVALVLGAFRKALAIADAGHPFHAEAAARYAAFLRRTRRKKEAKVFEARAQTAQQQHRRANGIGLTVTPSELRH